MATRKMSALQLIQLSLHDIQNAQSPQVVCQRLKQAVDVAIQWHLNFSGVFPALASSPLTKEWVKEVNLMEYYRLAVEKDNLSYCRACEEYLGFKPLFLNRKRIHRGGEYHINDCLVKCIAFVVRSEANDTYADFQRVGIPFTNYRKVHGRRPVKRTA